MLRKPQHLVPIAILLFWGVMTGMLLYREVYLPYLYQGAFTPRRDQPQDIWFGLYFGEEQRVGFVHLKTEPEARAEEPGYAMRVKARLAFPLFGQETRFQLSGNAWQSAAQGLREFDFTFGSGEHEMRIAGTAGDGAIRARLHTAGEEVEFNFPVSRDVLLSGGMGLNALTLPAMEPGTVAYVDAFDPTTMSAGRAKLEALSRETLMVAGEPVEALVIATTIGGISTRAWVDANQEVVRAETPFGLIIKKITPQQALETAQLDESANIVSSLAVTPTGLPLDPDAVHLRLRIAGLPDALMPPCDARQHCDGEVYLMSQQDPRANDNVDPLPAEVLDAALASDLFIQADHPRIREQAAAIVGGEQDAWNTAVLIHDWVYDAIRKEHVLSVPSALDVLEQRSGDCNEHAVLYAALARAAGIPARIAIGLAWSEKLSAFGYHAWVEVYVGQWIAMDPTFGERTVSPTHIKLLNGGIDQWPRLLPYIGAMTIEVLE